MTNNQELRALFVLPPVQTSTSTALATVETPAPKNETGDREIDAVLWLQDCVRTGEEALISHALEAAKKIKTPMKELGLRYGQILMRQHGSSFMAAMGSMGFGQLEEAAKHAIETRQKKHAAVSRFGAVENVFKLTPAEEACKGALRGLKQKKSKHGWHEYDPAKAQERFAKVACLQPFTLEDCIYAKAYWRELYWLRNAVDSYASDHHRECQAHDDFCFSQLAVILPSTRDEALSTLAWLSEEDDGFDRNESLDILRNLVGSGWVAQQPTRDLRDAGKG